MSGPERVLVTGGAGFIGSELVHQLAADGYHVVVVDNLVNGRRENLADLSPASVKLAIGDIRDAGLMRECLRSVSTVFHLACLGVRQSIHAPLENHAVNATATLDLLSLARGAGVERFVYVSSSEVYGTARTVPMTEDHPTYPKTVYGASKLAGECYTRAFFDTYGLPTVVIRPFNAYGPRCHHEGDSGEVIPKFLLRCLAGLPMVIFGDGKQTRDFTFVSDTARGIRTVGFSAAAIGQTINLGYGAEITIEELAGEIRRVTGCAEAPVVYDQPRPGDVLRLYADAGKARSLCGFSTAIPLREGLEKLKQWYLASDRSPEQLLEAERVRNWEAAPASAFESGSGK